jgi:hypothetical protein
MTHNPDSNPQSRINEVIMLNAEDTPAVEQKLEPGEYLFSTFPDGSLFRYCPHPSVEGKFCLLDVSGAVVAVVNHRAIADFLVRGAHCLCCYLRDNSAAEGGTCTRIPSTSWPS